MKLDKKVSQALVLGLAVADLFLLSFEEALMAFGIAAIVFGFTQSLEVIIVVLLGPRAIKGAYLLMESKEGFQAGNPEGVAERVRSVKVAQKNSEGPVGVLESPEIMSSEPLQNLKAMSNEALPGESIPASAVARVLINTPEEVSMPASETVNKIPTPNPILHNGPDLDAIESALIKTGAASSHSPADVEGMAIHSAPAF